MQVAKTIFEQLGGKKFALMTGARNFVGHDNSLTFRLGRNAASVNEVCIEYDQGKDLYNMIFLKTRAESVREFRKFDGIYCDQLEEIFTEVTGLYTRL